VDARTNGAPLSARLPRLLVPILVTLFAAAIYWQDVAANTIATGDHGRGLYAAWNVIRGEIPYRHFPFRYGPIGLYAVAPFLLAFGVTLKAAFLSWFVYSLISTFRLTQLLSHNTKWHIALLGILPFVLAYRNHMHSFITAPALLCMVEAFIAAVRLIRTDAKRGHWLRLGIWCALLVGCKPNIGLAFAAGMAAGLFLLHLVTRNSTDPFRPSRKLVIPGAAVFGGVLLLTALVFVAGAPADFLVKSFPYARDQRVVWGPVTTSLTIPFSYFLKAEGYQFKFAAFVALWRNSGYIWIISIACGFALILLAARRRSWPAEHRTVLVFFLPVILAAHEFILGGSDYAVTYWGLAGASVFYCAAVSATLQKLTSKDTGSQKQIIANIVIGCLATWFVFLAIWTNMENSYRYRVQKGMSIKAPGGGIHVYDPSWAAVVNSGVAFILNNTAPDEKILSLAYDPLYCALTHRRQAGPFAQYQLICRITPENDRTVIEALKRDKVRCIIISNLSKNPPQNARWKGIFGETHGKLLWNQIRENYSSIGRIGPWDEPARWIKNHAIEIYWTDEESDRHPDLQEELSSIYQTQSRFYNNDQQ
jgi:hypothetical protein